MLIRAAAVLFALAVGGIGVAGCASSAPADGEAAAAELATERLADVSPDDPRGLWVSERQVEREDTFPEGDTLTVVLWTELWASFRVTDSTLTQQGVRRYSSFEPQMAAGGSRVDAILDGETLTTVFDTVRVKLSLRVRGDSLFVAGPDGRTGGYRRAESSAPPAAIGTWAPEDPSADAPRRLIVSTDGFVSFGLDEPVGSVRVLGPFMAWGYSELELPPEMPGMYWNYEAVLPLGVSSDRLRVPLSANELTTFLRADR